MGERLLCKQEVIGSIPFTSTRSEAPIALAPCARVGVAARARRKTERPMKFGLPGVKTLAMVFEG